TPGRSKEYASDYRYFPEPDLTPIEPDPAWIEELRASLPELPARRRQRFASAYALSPQQVAVVTQDATWTDFFEGAVGLGADPQPVANWVGSDVAGLLNEHKVGLADSKLRAEHVADIVRLFASGQISSAGAKAALAVAFDTGEPIEQIVRDQGLTQVSDA